MKITPILLISLILIASQALGQTVTTVTDGDVKIASTWDCACVPGAGHDLIVDHNVSVGVSASFSSLHIRNGGTFEMNTSGGLGIQGDLTVDAGGTLITKRYTYAIGDFVLNGTWAGNQSLDLRGTGTTISGTGTITNTATLYLKGGDKEILAGTVLNKMSGIININSIRVDNYGSIRTSVMTSAGYARWVNKTDSRIEFVSALSGPLRLIALAPGNTVAFTRPGASQDIWLSHLSTFYNLELVSSGAWRKTMKTDLIIKGDLIMTDCLLETARAGNVYDIEIRGNWTSTGGSLSPHSGTVTFNSTVDVAITHDGEESFNQLLLNGPGNVLQAGDINVNGDLQNNVDLVMDVNAPRTITLAGDFNNVGSYTHNGGKIVMDGSSAQVLDGEFVYQDLTINNTGAGVTMNIADHTIHGTLDLLDGQLDTQDRLTMISDANGDSRIAEIIDGSLLGEVSAQRYIDAGATNWRFLTSPTSGNTIGDWTDDFNTSGFTGSTWPTFSFTSIYFHDESAPGTLDDGFVAATDASDVIAAGAGIWVWCGDNMTGTAPFTIDVEGEIYQGDVVLPVTYNSYGSPANDGWNMVANPYLSVIDWDAPEWNKVGINDAIYIWVPELEQFASYVAGVAVNGGSRYVASSQAFWVQTNSASPQLTAREGIKTAQAVGFKSANADDIVRITMSKAGLSDELVLRYHDAATPAFDASFDALERISANDDSPNFHSESADGENLMINSFAKANVDTTIQLSFQVSSNGTYTIDFTEISGRFTSSCIILEDQVLGTQTAISEGFSQTVSLTAGQNEDRFRLVVAGGIEYFEVATSCPGASDGMVVAQATGTGPHDYTWYDSDNTVIRNALGVTGADTLSGVASGNYTVSVEFGSPCGIVSAQAFVADPDPITAGEIVTASSCSGLADGMIDLNISGGSGAYTVLWSNGAATADIDQLAPGTYDVTISDEGGCSIQHSVVVPADFPVVAAFSAPLLANVGQPVIFQTNAVGATSAEWDMGDGATFQTTTSPVHIYTQPGIYTVQLIVYNGNCNDMATQDIEIQSIANGVNDLASMQQSGVTFGQNNGQVYVEVNGTATRDLQILVTNLVGQNIIAPMVGSYAPGKNSIDLNGNRNRIVVISAFDLNTGERWASRIAF